MEKETKVLLWVLFVIGILTVGYVPVAWITGQQTTDRGVVSTANLGHALWGTNMSIPSTVLTTMDNPPKVSIIPGATDPNITSISFDTTTWSPQITILGSGFGNRPTSGQAVLTVTDVSRGWMATNTSLNPVLVISSWTNTKVVISGLTGYGSGDIHNFADGLGSFVFARGDTITIALTNPQTGNVGTSTVTYPLSAPLPEVTLSTSSPSVETSTSTSVTVHVSFDGNALSHQAVNFSASSGTFSGANGTEVNGTDDMAFTDQNGNVTVNYQAGSSPDKVVIYAMADAVTNETMVNVVANPQIQLVDFSDEAFPPKVEVTGTGFGQPPYTSGNNLIIQDVSAGWVAGLTQGFVQPTVESWTDGQINVNGFLHYGSIDTSNGSDGQGSWSFRPEDTIRVQVTNPENHLASDWYTTTYPKNALMPTVTLQSIGAQMVGSSLSVTGTVTFEGQPLANQGVLLQCDSGVFTGGGQETSFGPYEVSTNSAGQFTAVFQTPTTTTTQTILATVDGQQAKTSFPVEMPSITWNAVPTIMAGQSVTVFGQVTWMGQGISHQSVVVNGQTAETDASGRFALNFTAPTTPGTIPLTATCDGAKGTASVEVTPSFTVTLRGSPTSQYGFTLEATVNHELQGQGYQAYIGILDTTTGTWVASGNSGTTLTADVTLSDGQKHAYVAYVLGNKENPRSDLTSSSSISAYPGYYYQTSVWVNGTCTTTESCTTQPVCTTTWNCTTSYGCRPGDSVDRFGFCWNPRTGSEENPIATRTCQPVTTCSSSSTCTPVTTCSQGYSTTAEAYSSPYVSSP